MNIKSKVYLVASLFNVGMLKEWKNRSFAKPYFIKAIESILDVVNPFLENSTVEITEEEEISIDQTI
jgi:hypothetical protein